MMIVAIVNSLGVLVYTIFVVYGLNNPSFFELFTTNISVYSSFSFAITTEQFGLVNTIVAGLLWLLWLHMIGQWLKGFWLPALYATYQLGALLVLLAVNLFLVRALPVWPPFIFYGLLTGISFLLIMSFCVAISTKRLNRQPSGF